MIADEGLDAVVSFSEAEHPPNYFHPLPENLSLESINLTESNRQEHKSYYRINGMLYLSKCDIYQMNRSFYGSKSKAFIIENKYAVDIDNEHDFALAEFLMERIRAGHDIR
jgi:CMP-N-acetylneuraminic acid synthetase